MVIGEENVGKSSVMELIAGIKIFPRSEGICTRLPFQMRMHHISNDDVTQLLLALTPLPFSYVITRHPTPPHSYLFD